MTIYINSNGTPHYVKLYGEGGLGDDGRGPEEAYTGTWNCERAHIDIIYYGEGIFHATVKWGASASTHAQWEYPLIFDNGKLICKEITMYVVFTMYIVISDYEKMDLYIIEYEPL